jgi:hypothetical protein
MGIQGYTTVGSPLGPNSTLDTYATHEDAFGKGGYRAITTQGSGTVALDSDINDVIPWRRRAVGMLVYDTRTTTYYRLGTLGTEPGGFGYGGQSLWEVEDFGGEGSVTKVGMTVPGGLSVTPLEITSEGTFAITLNGLNSIVKSDGANLTNATVSNNGTTADVAAGQHTQGYGSITGLGSGAKLLGHTTTGSGAAQLITIGQGLQLDGNQLKSLDAGGTVTSVAVAPTGVLTSNTNDLGQTYLITHEASGVVASISGTKAIGAGTTVPQITVNGTGHVTVLEGFTPSFLPLAGGTVTGTVTLDGIGSHLNVGGDLTITGDLTVNGEQTIVNSNTVQVVDRNIELAINAENDSQANGGGITLHGLQDKSFRWLLVTEAWTSTEHLELANGKAFRIDGEQVMSKTALGTTVVGSSLTSVGTLASGTWQANEIGLAYGGTGADLSAFAQGTIFMKGSGTALVEATAGTDYLDNQSVIDGGTY